MRIIAGAKRGMHLLCPKTQDTRPITDRVKESLFNVLNNYGLLADQRVGSLGLEALSRDAAFVTFVEQDPKIAAYLEKNIAKAGFVAQSRVIRANAFRCGAPLEASGLKYDLVFVDPPYATTREVDAGSSLADLLRILGDQVAHGGIVVVRTHRSVTLLNDYGSFHVVDRRQWGTMSVVLLQAKANEQQASGD